MNIQDFKSKIAAEDLTKDVALFKEHLLDRGFRFIEAVFQREKIPTFILYQDDLPYFRIVPQKLTEWRLWKGNSQFSIWSCDVGKVSIEEIESLLSMCSLYYESKE